MRDARENFVLALVRSVFTLIFILEKCDVAKLDQFPQRNKTVTVMRSILLKNS